MITSLSTLNYILYFVCLGLNAKIMVEVYSKDYSTSLTQMITYPSSPCRKLDIQP